MRVVDFFGQTRLLIVAGKGGVGKTTTTAALARLAADVGLRVLIVEVEGKSGLGALFGRPGPLPYEEVSLAPGIDARTLAPDDALVEYLEDHGMRRLSKRLVNTGAIDVVAAGAPGIKDILVLGKVKALERDGRHDLVLVDAPAAGHAVTFLTAATGLLDAVSVGPIRAQAQEVQTMLADKNRCQVLLVTLPEETPVNELVETGYRLEDEIGVALAPVVVNGVYPTIDPALLATDPTEAAAAVGRTLGASRGAALRDAASFRLHRQQLQGEQIDRLAQALPLPQLAMPFIFEAELGARQLATLAAALAEGIERL